MTSPTESSLGDSAGSSRSSTPPYATSHAKGRASYHFAQSSLDTLSSSSSSFGYINDSNYCNSPDSLYHTLSWADEKARRSSSTSSSSSEAPELQLRRFAHRQCRLLSESHPELHVIALLRGQPPPKSLQVSGCFDVDGERCEEGTIEAYQTILYGGQATATIDFILFDTGRVSLHDAAE